MRCESSGAPFARDVAKFPGAGGAQDAPQGIAIKLRGRS